LTSVQLRADDCSGRCATTPGCTHFTWDNYLGGTCWLKQGAIARTDAVFSNSPGIICGIASDPKPIQHGKVHFISIQLSKIVRKKAYVFISAFVNILCFFLDWQNGYRYIWSYKCAFEGKNLIGVQMRGEDCSGKCSSTAGCTHFTWDNYLEGTCWLKHGSITRMDAVYSNSPGIFCGIYNSTSQN
jgi:hypothetical protein